MVLPEMWHEQNSAEALGLSAKAVGLKFENYALLHHEQQRFMTESLGATTFSTAIHLLPKLCEIKISGSGRPRRLGGLSGLPPLYSWSGVWRDVNAFRLTKLVERPRPSRGRVYGLLKVLASLITSPSGAKIKHLSPGIMSIFWRWPNSSHQLGVTGFHHIESLEVDTWSFGFEGRQPRGHQRMKKMEIFLAEALNLKKLTLHIVPVDNHNNAGYIDLLGDFRPYLPKLRHFGLYHAYTTVGSLTTLLNGFYSSLATLRFETVSLRDSDGQWSFSMWPDVLAMFSLKDWNLKRIYLKNLGYSRPGTEKWLSAGYLMSVEDAVIHGTEFPHKEYFVDSRA